MGRRNTNSPTTPSLFRWLLCYLTVYKELRIMSIWQNFKDTDHEFEKKFFGVLALLTVSIIFFYFTGKLFDKLSDIKHLFVDNSNYFYGFIILLMFVSLLTLGIYSKTLGVYEAETKDTPKAAIKNAIIWTIFWISWSIFCAWLTKTNSSTTKLVLLTILFLVTVPGLISFVISRSIRNSQIRQEQNDKQKEGENYEPYTICLDRKYYSGYYGLVCLPVYLVALIF
jgi:hypothetical protein